MIPITNGDITLVILKKGKPYCKEHGAMNKVTKDGIYRCQSTYYSKPNGEIKENICRAGCEQRCECSKCKGEKK